MNREEFIKQFCIAAAPQMYSDYINNDFKTAGSVVDNALLLAEVMADELEKKFYFA